MMGPVAVVVIWIFAAAVMVVVGLGLVGRALRSLLRELRLGRRGLSMPLLGPGSRGCCAQPPEGILGKSLASRWCSWLWSSSWRRSWEEASWGLGLGFRFRLVRSVG